MTTTVTFTNYQINWTEAGEQYEGDNLTLKELNSRLASIQSKRLNEKDQSGWYYKTQVTMHSEGFSYTARIDFCPKSDYWPHMVFQDHVQKVLRYCFKQRNKKEYMGKISRNLCKGATQALKIMKGKAS